MTRINDLQTVFGQSSAAGDVKSAQATPKGGSAAAVPSNRSLTSDAQTVTVSSAAGALAQVADGDDVRADKVAQLKAAIDAGTYSVSSTAVADKLMQSMLGGR